MEPLEDRFIMIRNYSTSYGIRAFTDFSGQATIPYRGEDVIRITTYGSYIRDSIIFLNYKPEYAIAAAMLYLSGVVAGVATGIGLHSLLKRIHWL